MSNFKEMAQVREQEAAQLDDFEIWMHVISKFVDLDHPLSMRIEMMISAAGGDKNLVKEVLEKCIEQNRTDPIKTKEILSQIME